MSAIDISDETNALCAKFDLEPHMVARMSIQPDKATVVFYLPNDNGSKYVDDTGNVATATKVFEVTT